MTDFEKNKINSENGLSVDCNFLFHKEIKSKFKPYIRCELCIYSEKRSDLADDYIHCKKYPNMISRIDQTCKSSTRR